MFLSHLYAISPHCLVSEVGPHLDLHASRPTLVASILIVLAQSVVHINDVSKQREYAKPVIQLLHPFTACNFGHVRVSINGKTRGGRLESNTCSTRNTSATNLCQRALFILVCHFSWLFNIGIFAWFKTSGHLLRTLLLTSIFHWIVSMQCIAT